MLEDLLIINGYTFPKPKSFDLSLDDKINEFDAENGTRTLEIIREGIIKINVSYGSLTAEKLQAAKAAITKIATVSFYNPYTGEVEEKEMEVRGISTGKQYYDFNISMWSLSFSLEEL